MECLPKKNCKRFKAGSNLEVRLHAEQDKPSTSTSSESPFSIDSTQDIKMRKSFYVVVDTNMIIRRPHHIWQIKETPVEGCGPPHIFIPWTVFHELEGLKNSTDDFVANASTDGVEYLKASRHPRLYRQSVEELDKMNLKSGMSNDDKIIKCCVILAREMSREKVILLSDDKDMRKKAKKLGIVAHNWPSFRKAMKPDCGRFPGKKSPKKSEFEDDDESDPASMSPRAQKKLERNLVEERNIYKMEIDNIIAKALQLLKEVLHSFLMDEMDKTYGDAWHSFQIEKNTLRGILDAFLKHRNSVVCSLFTKKDFNNLYDIASRPKGFQGKVQECLTIPNTIKDVFCSILKSQTDINVPMEEIQKLSSKCANSFLAYSAFDPSISKVKSAIYASKVKSIPEMFDYNWTLINEFCGMAMDFYQVPHTFDYGKPDVPPPESEFQRVAPILYASLLQLKQLMQKMIHTVFKIAITPDIFQQLFEALRDLIPSLHIKAEGVPYFTTKALERFCRALENRQLIINGFHQLEIFCTKCHELILAMVSLKRKGATFGG